MRVSTYGSSVWFQWESLECMKYKNTMEHKPEIFLKKKRVWEQLHRSVWKNPKMCRCFFFSINRSSKSKYLMSVNYCCVYFFLIQSYSLFTFIHGIGQDQFVCCLQHLRLLIIFLQFKTEQVYNYFGNRRHCEPVQLKACNALFIWVSWVIFERCPW